MTDLQKEFEATGYTSWINSDLYPDGKIYTQEYTQWLERQVLALRQPLVSGALPVDSAIKEIENLMERWHLARDNDDETLQGINDVLVSIGLLGWFNRQ